MVGTRRAGGRLVLALAVLSCATLSCGSTGKASSTPTTTRTSTTSSNPAADVAARCDVHPTRAQLTLTKGQVIPADVTKTIGAAAAQHLYGVVCRAIVTAPPPPSGPVNCPAAAAVGESGAAKVVFYAEDRPVDTVDLVVTGCQSINSDRVGELAGFADDLAAFESVRRAIDRAFDVAPAQFGSR